MCRSSITAPCAEWSRRTRKSLSGDNVGWFAMCGIIACRTHRPATEFLSVGLRRLEYRGYDSVGVALQTSSGEVVRLRTAARIAALEKLLRDWSGAPFSGVGIGHTRW